MIEYLLHLQRSLNSQHINKRSNIKGKSGLQSSCWSRTLYESIKKMLKTSSAEVPFRKVLLRANKRVDLLGYSLVWTRTLSP